VSPLSSLTAGEGKGEGRKIIQISIIAHTTDEKGKKHDLSLIKKKRALADYLLRRKKGRGRRFCFALVKAEESDASGPAWKGEKVLRQPSSSCRRGEKKKGEGT